MNKKFLPLVFLLLSVSTFSQEKTYTDKNYHQTLNLLEAVYYVETELLATNQDAGYERFYFLSGEIRLEQYFKSFKDRILEGTKKVWRQDGGLSQERSYLNGKLHGPYISYWENGQLKRKDLYKKGKLKEKNVWDMQGNPVKWYPEMQRPQFPGGMNALTKYLQKNVKKPEGVKGGKVKVGFVIDVDGKIVDTRIEETTSINLNWAAYELVRNMPAWQPGMIDGKRVRVKYTLPLNFR